MKLKALSALAILFAFAVGLHAQGTPDCQFSSTFSAQSPGNAQSNKSVYCVAWRLAYYTAAATGVSIRLEGTNDVSGAPNAFGWTPLTSVPGTTSPATGTLNGEANYCCDYYPWIRVNPTTLTGGGGFSLTARSYGFKGTSAASYQGALGFFVPYTGATADVNLGTHTLSASGLNSGATLIPPGDIPLIFEPLQPIVSGAIENSVLMDVLTCDLWYGGSAPAPPWTTLYYTTATDSTCKNYAESVATDVTGQFGHVFKYGALWYRFGQNVAGVGSVYAWSSTDKIHWTALKSGNPVLTQTPGGPYENVANSRVVMVGAVAYMFIEAWPAGACSSLCGMIQFSYSDLTTLDFDTHRTTVGLFAGNSPNPVYVPSRSAIMVLHGTNDSAGVQPTGHISAHLVTGMGALATPASWLQAHFIIPGGGRFASNPTLTDTTGKDHPITIMYSSGEPATGYLLQAYADLTLTQFYDQALNGAPTLSQSATQDATVANNIRFGTLSTTVLPPSVPSIHTYHVQTVANGVKACVNASGCCWESTTAGNGTNNGTVGQICAHDTNDLYISIGLLPANYYVSGPPVVQTTSACSGPTTITMVGIGTSAHPQWLTGVTTYNLKTSVGPTNLIAPIPASMLMGAVDTSAATNLMLSIQTTGANVDQIVPGCKIAVRVPWGIAP